MVIYFSNFSSFFSLDTVNFVKIAKYMNEPISAHMVENKNASR